MRLVEDLIAPTVGTSSGLPLASPGEVQEASASDAGNAAATATSPHFPVLLKVCPTPTIPPSTATINFTPTPRGDGLLCHVRPSDEVQVVVTNGPLRSGPHVSFDGPPVTNTATYPPA